MPITLCAWSDGRDYGRLLIIVFKTVELHFCFTVVFKIDAGFIVVTEARPVGNVSIVNLGNIIDFDREFIVLDLDFTFEKTTGANTQVDIPIIALRDAGTDDGPEVIT